MPILKSDTPDPLVFSPDQGKPQQLFVLLHGESANPEQLLPLAQAIKQAFPNALVVIPYGPYGIENMQAGQYQWLKSDDPGKSNDAAHVAQALPALIAQIQQLQARHGLSGEQTALAGFSQGATLALEACMAQPDLAGRVLAFSGCYASPPAVAPRATTLHFLHGADDTLVPVSQIRNTHARLAELRGDATLDIASTIGHELHPALIHQALHRLQTCVPLRSWEAALGDLNAENEDEDGEEGGGDDSDPGKDWAGNRTLH